MGDTTTIYYTGPPLHTVTLAREPLQLEPIDLYHARRKAKLSLRDIAKQLNIPSRMAGGIERGAIPADPELVWAWLCLCGSRLLAPSGHYLREGRHRAGLTQGEVAQAVGLSTASVSLIERRLSTISLDTASKWLEVCGCLPQ